VNTLHKGDDDDGDDDDDDYYYYYDNKNIIGVLKLAVRSVCYIERVGELTFRQQLF
jgi:hypothetical protein